MCSEQLISVIITTYKRQPEILLRAVKSVLRQTHRNLELFIVNDYPEDAGLAQHIHSSLDELNDERVHYVEHEKNGGACKARNTGIANSLGEFVAFLDDDDLWKEDKLEKQLKQFTSDSIGAVTCDYCTINEESLLKLSRVTHTGSKKKTLVESLLWRNCVGGCSEPLIRRSVLDKVGGFDESLPASQDYDMWMRIALNYEIVFLHEALVTHYYTDDSITGSYKKKVGGFKIFQDKYAGLYQQNKDALNFRYANKVSLALANRHFIDAVGFMMDAVLTKPVSRYNVLEPLKGFVKLVKSFKR